MSHPCKQDKPPRRVVNAPEWVFWVFVAPFLVPYALWEMAQEDLRRAAPPQSGPTPSGDQ